MLLDHVFRNIDEAIDYILVEEIEEFRKDWRRHVYPLQTSDFRQLIDIDSFDNSYSGYFNNAPLDKFIMTRLSNGRYALKPNLKKSKFLYRGQNGYYDPCTPSLFRNPDQSYYIEECMLGQELYLLILSHPLVQLLDLGIQYKGKTYRFAVNPTGLMQHYYNKTRQIDLTRDINIAAFFAVTDYNWEADMYSPVLDENREGVLYYYNLDIECDFKADKTGIPIPRLTTVGLQVFPRSERQQGFIYDVHRGENFNNHPRLTAVKFRHNAHISQRIFESYEHGKYLFPDDILMKHWRRENKDRKLLSEISLEYNHRENPNKSKDQLRSMMEEKGYQFKKNKPHFNEEEIKDYYLSIKDGFWEEFCSKIYIPEDKDGSFMETLLNAPNNPDYMWAFRPDIPHKVDCAKGYLLRKDRQFFS